MSNLMGTGSGGRPSLEGYMYQMDVSTWTALNLLLAKKLAQTLVLEPASQEDLETDIESEPGALVQGADLSNYRLVIQCKLRNTGPWKHGDLGKLLAHGTLRKSARIRLEEDPSVHYLLVTNADVYGVARHLLTAELGEWPPIGSIPQELAKVLPDEAGGRVAVLASLDSEKLHARIERLLTERFRVPRPNLLGCQKELEASALRRMCGAGHGVWKRKEIEAVILKHGGDVGDRATSEKFVQPNNWNKLLEKLATQHALIITGPSGTGKTSAAQALLAQLRHDLHGVKVVRIDGGPEQIKAHMHERPVAFEIEDPWGGFRLEPSSAPWNDKINDVLRQAGPDCKFVITTRSDVFKESGLKSVHKKWFVLLEEEDYGRDQRIQMFENRLSGLPHAIQLQVLPYTDTVVDRLVTPLEIQRYFDVLADGPDEGERSSDYFQRCLVEAEEELIEKAVLNNIRKRDAWRWGAVVWGLFKAGRRQSFSVLPSIQAELTKRDPDCEDGLEPYIHFLIAGHNLRQIESTLAYQHPRVEKGLEMALNEKPELSSRSLCYLVEALIAVDKESGGDWGREGAARLLAAARAQQKLRLKLAAETQEQLDAWIAPRLSKPGVEFENDLKIAAVVGSPNCAPAELARWLTIRRAQRTGLAFDDWSPGTAPAAWYEEIARDSATKPICDAFIQIVLPSYRVHFPPDFCKHIGRLVPNLAPAFRDAAFYLVNHRAFPGPALIQGALEDLQGFQPVLQLAIKWFAERRELIDDGTWLAVENGEYDELDEDFYAEKIDEAGDDAQAVIYAYVSALRQRKGWQSLREHPFAEDLLCSWLRVPDRRDVASEEEIEALAEASFNTLAEPLFWDLAIRQWTPKLARMLLVRVRSGAEDARTRLGAARVFAKHLRFAIPSVIDDLSKITRTDRLVEFAFDLCRSGRNIEERKIAEAGTQELVQALPPYFAEAVLAILGKQRLCMDSQAAQTLLLSLNAGTNRPLKLAQAQVIASCGIDVTRILIGLLKTSCDGSDEEVSVAIDAVRLAIKQEAWSVVEEALLHRFADVRRCALDALAGRVNGPLPSNLLALAEDKSNRVRKALLGVLKTRPYTEHFFVHIKLSMDTWSRGGHDLDTADYPIARAAAECIRDSYPFIDSYTDTIIGIARTSADLRVGSALLAYLLRKGSLESKSKVVESALRGATPLHRIAANALAQETNHLGQSVVARISHKDLAQLPVSVAVPLSFVVGAVAKDESVIATARSLAVHSTRRALLVPLRIGAATRQPSLLVEIDKLLPAELVRSLPGALMQGGALPWGALNDFGDIRVIAAIRAYFSSFFEADPEDPFS